MKKLFTLAVMVMGLVLFSASYVLSQVTVTGVVSDETGETLIGANILEKGTSNGTITDFDGSYSLTVSEGATLVFSFTGYAEQEIPVNGQSTIDVVLREGAVLDEVVVIGYGVAKKSDLTGSTVAVGEEDFNQGVLTSPDQLIQGRAAGVQMTPNSGQPGGAATIRIRGISSLRGGNNPLFVVDGVPLSGISSKPDADLGAAGSTQGSNPLNFLNPNDIESVQILKDASATAIYGSRGANGVVLITTKKGRSGDPTVTFNTSVGTSNIVKRYDVLDAAEFRDALNTFDLGDRSDYGDNVNAMDEILQNGFTQNYNFTIGGGNDNGNYRISGGYLDQDGIIKNSSFRKLTASLNGSYKFLESKKLRVDVGLIASNVEDEQPFITTDAGFEGNIVSAALTWNPTHPFRNEDGSLIIEPQFGQSFYNPLALLEGYRDRSNGTDILLNIAPSYEIIDGLTYKLLYSYAKGTGERRASIRPWLNVVGSQGIGRASLSQRDVTTQNLTHTLNLVRDLSSEVNLNAVAGYEYQKIDQTGFGISGQGFTSPDFEDLTNVLQNSSQGSRRITSFADPIVELQSYFGRANVNISDKYLLTATVRVDGSSKFGENNKYGTFPSFALGWNIHNEDFFNSDLFDNLKFRAGWGQVGNQEFPAGASQRRIRFEDNGLGSTTPENVANPDLKWETTTTFNVGLDFAIMDYKLSGAIDYFNSTTNDLLFNLNAIPPAPAVTYWDNIDANIIQSGIEFSLNYAAISNDNMTLDFNGNVSFLSNEITDYNGGLIETGQIFGQGVSNAVSQRLANDRPLYSWYLQEFTGIGDDGQATFANNGQRDFTGTSPNPNTILGFTTNLTAGNFGFVMNWNGAFGHEIYNNTLNTILPVNNINGGRNIAASHLEGSSLESVTSPIQVSDRYLESGSFLKLSNVTLSYNVGNIGDDIKNVKLFVTGQNMFVLTGYNGFDPEVNTVNENANGIPSFGIEYAPYPSARTIIVGANFGF